MKKLKTMAKKFVVRYGGTIACCAFAFLAMTSNSSSIFMYYEPEEPKGLERFKKIN